MAAPSFYDLIRSSALLLQVLYSIRSERQLMEQLDYNLLYRWLVGLNMDDPIWDISIFTKNRQRLLDGEVTEAFFDAVLARALSSGGAVTSALRSFRTPPQSEEFLRKTPSLRRASAW